MENMVTLVLLCTLVSPDPLMECDFTILENNSMFCGQFWVLAGWKLEAKYQKAKKMFFWESFCDPESNSGELGDKGEVWSWINNSCNKKAEIQSASTGCCHHHKLACTEKRSHSYAEQNY